MTAIDLVEQRLIAAGCDPKRRGDKLTSKCPAHDDSSPSLSVSPGVKRDVLITCFANCEAQAVMDALNLKWTDFGDGPKTDTMTVAATYDYTTADGDLVYQVVRYTPKTFRQRRPDGHGGWTWGLGDVERTLYNMPAVAAALATGDTIYIVEGEKDADALTRAGVVATCNSGGAGKFTMDMAALLEGANVIIVADRDDVGTDHAAQVSWLLRATGVASLSTVEAFVGKDASDHLAAGHSIADFVPLKVEAQAPPAHPLARFAIDWPSFWTNEGKGADWLLEPLFARGRGHAIYAGAKTGKSYVVLAACAAIATGKPFLGYPGGEPIDVVYMDYEMTEDDLRDRLEEFGYGPDDDLSHLHYILLPTIEGLDTEEGGKVLVDTAKAVGAQLVIIDTTGRAVGGEENSADTMRAFYRHSGLALKQAEIAFARLDHAGKDVTKGQRGSSAKNDDVDVVVQMTNMDGGKRLRATHRRMSWYPELTEIRVIEDASGVEFKGGTHMWAHGTKELADAFDEWGLPRGTGKPSLEKDYKAHLEQWHQVHGVNVTHQLKKDALRFWKSQHDTDWATS